MTQEQKDLGPAERIITSLLTYTDHLYHNRPGMITPEISCVGVRWRPVTHKIENNQKVVYEIIKNGKKNRRIRVGILDEDTNNIKDGRIQKGKYRKSGIFPEVAIYFYRQIAEIYKLDNEFVARWASYAFQQKHRDLKILLAAFLLVQSRKGAPQKEDGEVLFFDEDYRDVGEAMMLIQQKGNDLDVKQLLRIREILLIPEIVEINRELGFSNSYRNPSLGRWTAVVHKWLRFREQNPQMLKGLVKKGFRRTVQKIARLSGYKPISEEFFQILRWPQKQSKEGHRTIAIGKKVKKGESWKGLTETQICKKIIKDKPDWKRIVGLLPSTVGMTRAVVGASIEAGSLSDKDLIILTPTIEELGLHKVDEIRRRIDLALKNAEDMRAANIARNVRSKDLKEKLEEGADIVAKKTVKEVIKNIRVYFFVDISSSMTGALEAAKPLAAKLLQSFPTEQLHVAVFNTHGRVVDIKHPSTKGVESAFRGIKAGGATDYGAGVLALSKFQPRPDEDVLFIFIGDEEARPFDAAVRKSNLNPMAFGFMKTTALNGLAGWRTRHYGVDHNVAVRETAANLGIPCFMIDNKTFEDPYAIPRTIRNLVAATPVDQNKISDTRPVRISLVKQILDTELLKKPAWAQ